MSKARVRQTFGKRNQAILDRAMEHIKDAPYPVSLRWVFYRLLQEGIYQKKSQYRSHWKGLSKDARRSRNGDWRPYTLTDDTRASYLDGWGADSTKQWLDNLKPKCYLDKYRDQDQYIELWYEARAMHAQFAYYTDHITLVPMGGDPSLPFRWDLAKRLEKAYERYQLPMSVLYFGDWDYKGKKIFNSIKDDVTDWCPYTFNLRWCGITKEQAKRYDVPGEKGDFQWEGLSNQAAKEIITDAIEPMLCPGITDDLEQEEQQVESFVRGKLDAARKEWTKQLDNN